MRPTTTTALALAGTALALPAGVALADTNDDPPSPTESVLAAPFAGHLTMNAQMRAERREAIVERLAPKVIRTKHKTAKVKGVKFEHRAQKRRLRGDSPKELRTKLERSRRELRKAKRAAASAETGQAAAAGAAPAAPPGHRGLRVRRGPQRRRRQRHVPREVPVRYADLGQRGRNRRPCRRLRGRAGRPRGAALRAVWLHPLARLRSVDAQESRKQRRGVLDGVATATGGGHGVPDMASASAYGLDVIDISRWSPAIRAGIESEDRDVDLRRTHL